MKQRTIERKKTTQVHGTLMKAEPYLTESNREKKLDDWISSLDRKRKWKDAPNKSALLVLDMQRFFLEPRSHAFVPSGRTIIPGIKEAIERFDGPVIFTRHLKGSPGNLMNQWWRDRIEGDPSLIVPELAPLAEDTVSKEHYSAFFETDLEHLLKDQGVDSIIITGILTDLCCESTARDAFMRGFKVHFTADLTASATEKRHLSTLNIISKAFGEVITSKDIM